MKDAKSIFAQMLAEVVIPEILNEPEPKSIEHEFSKKFEKKMSKIIKVNKKSRRKIVSIATRFAACIAAVCIVSDVLNVFTNAGRNPAVDYLVLHQYNCDDIYILCDENYPFPKTIEEEYTIDLPEGFALVKDETDEFSIYRVYENNDKRIRFEQHVLPAGMTPSVDNEHGINEIITDENETKYFTHIDEEEGYYYIMWSNDIYLFMLSTNIDKETMFNLCKSTKIK